LAIVISRPIILSFRSLNKPKAQKYRLPVFKKCILRVHQLIIIIWIGNHQNIIPMIFIKLKRSQLFHSHEVSTTRWLTLLVLNKHKKQRNQVNPHRIFRNKKVQKMNLVILLLGNSNSCYSWISKRVVNQPRHKYLLLPIQIHLYFRKRHYYKKTMKKFNYNSRSKLKTRMQRIVDKLNQVKKYPRSIKSSHK